MNLTIWKKSFGDAFWSILWCSALLLLISSVFVWITSLIKLGVLSGFLQSLPFPIEKLMGISMDAVASVPGRIALMFVDPVIVFTLAGWAITRGSDVVAGEIDRGTMEILLAQPIKRLWIIITHATVALIGAMILSGSVLLGIFIGLQIVKFDQPVDITIFIPASLNLVSMTFFVVAYSSLLSAFGRSRSRTMGFAGVIFIGSLLIKMLGRAWDAGSWLLYCTFLGAFEPQKMVTEPDKTWSLLATYLTVHILLSVALYLVSIVYFSKRDIPAPL